MTRQPASVDPPVALTVAGSDSGGGAGIQADLKTMEACGAFGTSVVTSLTAQNTTGVESTHLVPVPEVEAQLDAVLGDFDVAAVKTGMLATRAVVDLVADRAPELPHLVVDPVMVAASGDRLLEQAAERAYEDLIAESHLVTPNADEAAVLTDIDPDGEADARAAGERLVEMGADAALVKGGHIEGTDGDVVDVLVTEASVETFRHERVESTATHGSGCTLSSAVAAQLAQGTPLTDAVADAVDLLARAVRYPLDVGTGPGSVHHLVETRERAARDPTAEAVEAVVDALVERDVTPLVPAGGMNVVGATPYAERPDEVAAVEGKMARTRSGVRPNRGVRFDASTALARLLLAAREGDASLRFAAGCRSGEAVAAALDTLDGAVARVDRDAADGESEAATRAVGRAVAGIDGTPAAVVDRSGAVDGPVVVAPDAGTLRARVLAVLDEMA